MNKTKINLSGLDYVIYEDGRVEKRRGEGFRKPFPDKDGYLKM